MGYADDHPGYAIDTEEQARNALLQLVQDVEVARRDCDVYIPDNLQMTAELQKKAYAKFMLKHGSALGMVQTLHRCRRLSDIAYNELRTRVLNTLAPTIIGVAR